MYELAEFGQSVVDDGRLKNLRELLGWSLNAMAEALQTSPQVYSSWESRPEIKLWKRTADRVGRFYVTAHLVLDDVLATNMRLGDYVPFHMAASQLGVPQEVLLQRHRAGELPAEDLGLLGLWVPRSAL